MSDKKPDDPAKSKPWYKKDIFKWSMIVIVILLGIFVIILFLKAMGRYARARLNPTAKMYGVLPKNEYSPDLNY